MRLSGHVTEPYARTPLAEVHVTVEPLEGSAAPRTTHTSPSGDFVITGLCAGRHRVNAGLHGYVSVQLDVTLPGPHLDLVLEEDFEEVVVATERLGRDETRSATTLEGAALERTRGQDLAHALADVPGVAVLGGSSATSQPMIRGQWGRRVLVLQDGVRHASQKWGADHGTEVDPFSASAITVVRGAAGVRHGPDAIGGVILVTPRPLRNTPGADAEVHLLGNLNGQRGTAAFRVDGAHAKAPGLAWRAEGNVARGGALSAPDYVLGNTGSLLWNTGLTFGWHGPRADIQLSWRHHDLMAGVFYGLTNDSPDDFRASLVRDRPLLADVWSPSFTIDRPKQEVAHDTVLARADLTVPGVGEVGLAYSFQNDRRREYDAVREAITGPQYDFTLRTHQLDAHLHHVPVPLGGEVKLEGTAGAWGQVQENQYRGLQLIPNYLSGNLGVFVHERAWHPAFEVELGARYDHRTQTARMSDNAYASHVRRGTLVTEACTVEDDVATCPDAWNTGSVSLGGLWRALPEHLHLKLDLSSASRFPDADELYLNGTAPTFPVYGLGAPDLGVETTWSGSLTVVLQTPWVRGEASAFGSYVDDYILFAPERTADGTPIFDVVIRGAFPRYGHSAVDAWFYGFDGQLSVAPDWHLGLDVGASIVRAEQVGGGFLPFVPPDRVHGTLTARLPDGGGLSGTFLAVRGTFVDRQHRWDDGSDLAPPPPAYGLLGLSAGTELTIGEQVLTIGMEARNLLNTAYRDATSLIRFYADEPGRDVSLRLSAQLAL